MLKLCPLQCILGHRDGGVAVTVSVDRYDQCVRRDLLDPLFKTSHPQI